MPSLSSRRRDDAIRRSLAERAGDAPSANAYAEATLDICQLMSIRLTPVIGVRGVGALFHRSLHLTSRTYPWLALRGKRRHSGNHTLLLDGLRSRLAKSEATLAEEASHSLLVSVTDLLGSLIGESLTDQLLDAVWIVEQPERNRRAEDEHD